MGDGAVKRRSAGPGPDRAKTKDSRGARDTSRCHRAVSSQWTGEELAPNFPSLVLIRYREEAWGVVRWRMRAKLVQLLGSLQLLHTFVVLGPSLSLTPGGFLSTETQ